MTSIPMQFTHRSLSVRQHLFVLVLAVFLPAVGIFTWNVVQEWQTARKDAYASVRMLADETAATISDILHENEAVLGRLAARPLIRTLDSRNCDPLLRDYISLHPEFRTLALRDRQAKLVCTLIPNPPAAGRVIQIPWFQEALRSNKFTVSDASLSPERGRWVSISAFPVHNESDDLAGFVFFSVDLLKLNQQIFHSVPKNSVISVIDRQEKFLLRSADPEKWIGQSLPDVNASRVRGQSEGYFTRSGADGGPIRLYAFVTIPGTGWRVFAGLPEDDVFATSRARLYRSIAVGICVLLLALALAYWIGSTIVKPVHNLARTAARISLGDSRARAQAGGPVEIAAVAMQINRMLDVRTLADEELKESERRYRLLFESSPWPMWVFDTNQLNFLAVNDAAVQSYGYTREEFLAMTIEQIRPAESISRLRDWLQTQDDAPRRTTQSRHIKKNGQVIDVEIMSHSLEFFGKPARLVVAHDISERKAAEATRNLLESQLRQAQKMEAMGTLAGGIAHDFNNILAAILGNVALARSDLEENHAARVSLDEIDKAGNRAKHLVQQILAFSRNQPQVFSSRPLRPLVEETLRLMRATLPAGVELTSTLADTPIWVRADAIQIGQVLMNLCTNAWHALQGRNGHLGVVLDTVFLDAEAGRPPLGALSPGNYARLRVRDDGCGMDAATQARIFDPFFTTKPVGEGTGLGLTVVHGILAAHLGAIAVDSAPGSGTTVTVYLPAVEAPAQTAEPASAARALGKGDDRHILYLDDDEALVFMAQRLLQKAGYRVSGFTSAEAALAAVRTSPVKGAGDYDLVVTDFNMPGLSGLDVARELARMRPDLPVVITSGYITEELKAGARSFGVRHILYKPNTTDELCQSLQRLLDAENI